MSSYIEEFTSQAKLEDRLAVVRQLLLIRYAKTQEAPSSIIEFLAKIPSNKMLRILLTHSWEELLALKEEKLLDIDASTIAHDIFRIIGPIEEYYIQKEGEKKAIYTLAKLRVGEIDEMVSFALANLLQTSASNSVHALYTMTREDLIAQFCKKSASL